LEIFFQWIADCKKFVEGGGDEALFWAGKMSDCVDGLEKSNLFGVSHWFSMLSRSKREYDRIIMETHMENKKKQAQNG
jgi:hypothetical protein